MTPEIRGAGTQPSLASRCKTSSSTCTALSGSQAKFTATAVLTAKVKHNGIQRVHFRAAAARRSLRLYLRAPALPRAGALHCLCADPLTATHIPRVTQAHGQGGRHHLSFAPSSRLVFAAASSVYVAVPLCPSASATSSSCLCVTLELILIFLIPSFLSVQPPPTTPALSPHSLCPHYP